MGKLTANHEAPEVALIARLQAKTVPSLVAPPSSLKSPEIADRPTQKPVQSDAVGAGGGPPRHPALRQ